MLKKFTSKIIWYFWNQIADFELFIWCKYEKEFLDIIINENLEKSINCK